MSFSEKVKMRLEALEKQVAALDQRLKPLEKPLELPVVSLPMEVVDKELTKSLVEVVKRGPGRPRKVVNG